MSVMRKAIKISRIFSHLMQKVRSQSVSDTHPNLLALERKSVNFPPNHAVHSPHFSITEALNVILIHKFQGTLHFLFTKNLETQPKMRINWLIEYQKLFLPHRRNRYNSNTSVRIIDPPLLTQIHRWNNRNCNICRSIIFYRTLFYLFQARQSIFLCHRVCLKLPRI